MGSGNSRLGGSGHPPPARPHRRHPQRRRPSFKRSFSSLLICGASSSLPHDEMEDGPAELLVNSAQHSDLDKIKFPAKSSTLSTDCGNECPQHRVVNSLSSENAICCSGNHTSEDVPRISESKKSMEGLSKKKGLHSSAEVTDNLRSNETTGMSSHNEFFPESLIADRNANVDAVDNGKGKINEVASNSVGCNSSDGSSSDAVESCDEMSHENEVMIFRECDFTSGSAPSESSLDCTLQTSSSGVGSSVTDTEEDHRNGNELQIDRAINSSNFLSNSSSGLTSHEAGHNNRRLFWDSFSRRNLRRNANSRTFLFGPDDAEGSGFHNDRSLLDLDFFDYEIGGSSRSHRINNLGINELRSNSEVWERSRDIDSGSDRRATFCPSGIHPDGTCSCGSIFTGEESGARANISRIVMLAQTLFEAQVLDEVHRQPMSLSLSMVCRPAPEAVVDSLPVKSFTELGRREGRDDFKECYICLNEYAEGDAIRILPCDHEFHMDCVDKWLKGVHGVCPLCRGDVREGSSKAASI